MKIYFKITLAALVLLVSCRKQFEEYPANPNLPNENSVIPAEFLLRSLLLEIQQGGGVFDGRPGSVPEQVFQGISRWSQYQSGLTFPLYGGSNLYTWTNTASPYSMIRNANKMEQQAIDANGEQNNPYVTVSKFIKVYAYIWYTQRVGDIPMSEAGMGLEVLTPRFDEQKEVYRQCLDLLDEANDELASIINDPAAIPLNGDFYYSGNLFKWRKAVNSFKIRILISLSKRADDTPDLQIKQRFADILQDPNKYPIFENNQDNLAFDWVAVSDRPDLRWRELFANETTVSSTILDITTSTQDPRTFLFATPASVEINDNGKSINDFTAYVGSPNGTAQGTLFNSAEDGMYSYVNFIRYLDDKIDNYPEPKRILSYSELCFNIAEGINRGWAAGNDGDWYNNGVQASLDFFGLSDGLSIPIGNVTGVPYGDVTASVSDFLSHPDVAYKGGQDGLEQIVTQKYVDFWQTGSWEPIYNYRRTGIPEFDLGPGTNPQQQIPLRWMYPPAEVQNNPNASSAIQSQFGSDNIFAEMWLIKD